MIWPYQTVYASEKLHLPLAEITTLLSISAFSTMTSSFLFSPLIDRMGRKWMMVGGLLLHAFSLILLSRAGTYWDFFFLMGLNGLAGPIYRIGADAMMSDLVPPEQRIDGYALLRLSNNMGIAVGPMIASLLITQSFTPVFYGGAAGLSIYALMMACFGRETLPAHFKLSLLTQRSEHPDERFGGFLRLAKDNVFMSFLVSFTLVQFCAVMIWQLMPIFAMQYFHIPKNQYGFLPTTNALMVVFLQVIVTAISRQFAPLPMIALGSLLYAVAVGGVAFSRIFPHFWLVMVVMTSGELLLMPTASTFIANLAPADMRGRYMGLFNLSWSLAGIVAPLLGGISSDRFGIQVPWIAAMLIGSVAALSFLIWHFRNRSGAAKLKLQMLD